MVAVDYIGIHMLNKLISIHHLDKKMLTLEHLLKVIVDNYPNILIKKFNEAFPNVNDIKYENIICYKIPGNPNKYKYYRRTSLDVNGNKIKVKNAFLESEDKLLYNIPQSEPQIELEIDDNICVIGLEVIDLKDNHTKRFLECNGKICEIKRINHGTSFRQKLEAEYAPYNLYGNWFTGLNKNVFDDNKKAHSSLTDDDIELMTLAGESLAYTTEFTTLGQIPSSPGFFYEYKVKNPVNLLNMNESAGIEYMILIFMFFDIQLRNYDGTTPIIIEQKLTLDRTKQYCIAYYENNTVRDSTNKIGKYNYTIMKNNLDLKNSTIPAFNTGIWDVIRSETADDGDKALAAKFCTNFNQIKDDLHLNLAGWLVKQIFYFMFCNPKEILENTGVYILLRDETFGKDILNILLKKLEDLKTKNQDLFDIVTIAQETKTLHIKRNKYEEFNKKIASKFSQLKIDVHTEYESSVKTNLPTKIDQEINNILLSLIDKIIEKIKNNHNKFTDDSPINGIFKYNLLSKISIPDLIKFLFTNNNSQMIENKIKNLWDDYNDVNYTTYLVKLSAKLQELKKYLTEYLNGREIIGKVTQLIKPLLVELYKCILYSLTIYYDNAVTMFSYTFENVENNKDATNTIINNPEDKYNELISTQIDLDIVDILSGDILTRGLANVDITNLISKSTIQKFNDDFIQLGGNNDAYYKAKYLKYKQKYLQLKKS